MHGCLEVSKRIFVYKYTALGPNDSQQPFKKKTPWERQDEMKTEVSEILETFPDGVQSITQSILHSVILPSTWKCSTAPKHTALCICI